ncbi:hypothetical protein [Compostibacter hankyongensis]|uniref:Cell division protein FtsQ n=1 Tax=Compostibacter hankyongensis TaxID=1007089 RepID=A0ABP8FGR0_9BACT
MAALKKKHIGTFFSRLLWVLLAAGLGVGVVAAMRIRHQQQCRGLLIDIVNNDGVPVFVEKSGIRNLILQDKNLNPVGKDLDDVDMRRLERTVTANPWVNAAELYTDNDGQLHIRITQKQPLARVFTRSGSSFYIDREGGSVPVVSRFTARVPVFTNYPSDSIKTRADSLLFARATALSRFLSSDSFWMAQVEQINVNASGEFELIPKIGNQLILFGSGDRIPEKFTKLMLFYKKGLGTLGWRSYDTLDIRYEDEVVGSLKGSTSPVPVPADADLRNSLPKGERDSAEEAPQRRIKPAEKAPVLKNTVSEKRESRSVKRSSEKTQTRRPKAVYKGPERN